MRLGRKSSSYTRPWTQRQRVVLLGLIGANLFAFVAQVFLESYQPGFVREFLGISKNGVQSAYAWQFLTAIFMHDGPWHLLGNTIVLYLLGRDVESILGQRDFLLLYLWGAAAGELGHLFIMPAETVLFAASGGIAAVVMAYATILPEMELAAVTIVFRWCIKAKYLAYGAVAVGFVLVFVDRFGTVTHSAYLGGCAAGWLYAHLLDSVAPSFLQRALHQRRASAERYRQMDAEQFIAEEVDPLLDKISRKGLQSLSRGNDELSRVAREKLEEKS